MRTRSVTSWMLIASTRGRRVGVRGAGSAAEGVLDLGREVADELQVGLVLLEDLGFARDLQLLLELAQLEHEARLARLDRADHAVKVHALASHVELEVVLVEAGFGLERTAQVLQEVLVAGKGLVDAHAQKVLAPIGQQCLGGGIRVGHLQAFVEHQDGGGQQLETGVRYHDLSPRKKAISAPAGEAGAAAERGCRKGRLREARASARRALS